MNRLTAIKAVFRSRSIVRRVFAALIVASFLMVEICPPLAAQVSQQKFASKVAEDSLRLIEDMSKDFTSSGISATRPDFEKDLLVLTDVATREFLDEGLKEIIKNYGEEAGRLTELTLKTRQKFKKTGKGYSDIHKDLSTADEIVKGNQNKVSWLNRLKRILNAINIAEIVGSAAGHLYEGDIHGTAGTILDEVAEKSVTALGAVIGTPVPGGTIVGSALAEELYDRYFRSGLESSVDVARDEYTKKQMLKDPFPREHVYRTDGSIYTLPSGFYLDPDTLNIKKYTPEHMKAIREGRRDERERLNDNTHPLNVARIKMERGEMSRAEFDQLVNDYNEKGLAGITTPSDADAKKQPANIGSRTPTQGKTIVPPRVISEKIEGILPPPDPH